ncbi:SDR family NAD(P)-dependent oxidoreductase [Kineosporia succinea]|uniref:NAD(P)-dependent dehydrogenase (Short-subunit alcohol dehydrogenase family) n=1 Tax=Kineosporia succinea TaxID=84632 RepID=A0ABT9P848_9ACTN|nr:SDR family NAD(P)-dependent oxidoreductase [Kineosporia succinea]MDP9828883.1 NAD(P)-dependent dehydrogenase (short-subunit alcohol dehydrogenase family) [Kineosporia succinea]
MTTVLITGPTRSLGRVTAEALARHPEVEDLLLVGRRGPALDEVAERVRRPGVRAHPIGCDLADLSDVRSAAATVRGLVEAGTVRPLLALIANAGIASSDGMRASADGHELTFAVNHLAHAQLVGDLEPVLAPTARIVLLGSNTYYANIWRRLMHVPPANWRDPLELAEPGTGSSGMTAYSDSKLAILYYAHELQRRIAPGVSVVVYEPGWMPGTALGRGAPPAVQAVGRALGHIPGVATPERSGPLLAAVAVDARWAHLRDGAFVVRDRVVEVQPLAQDRDRERRLWEATAELLA